jgi:hypothetical protein
LKKKKKNTAYSGKINKLKATIEKEEARIVRTAQETKEIERKQDGVRDEMYGTHTRF